MYRTPKKPLQQIINTDLVCLVTYYECCRCLNSSQSALTSLSTKKSLGTIFANINLKPTEVEFASLLSLTKASLVRVPIK